MPSDEDPRKGDLFQWCLVNEDTNLEEKGGGKQVRVQTRRVMSLSTLQLDSPMCCIQHLSLGLAKVSLDFLPAGKVVLLSQRYKCGTCRQLYRKKSKMGLVPQDFVGHMP